ncbi:MAG: MFS transporter, partial [Rhodospirillaceae bacterium]|nr:MFS transporter [Rhodospirillaceae bacterium]
NRLLERFGAANLLALGAAAGIIRWTAMGLSDSLGLALLTQGLHAFTFGATHLGAMHFIARAAPEEMSATAQSLHGAVGAGIAVGIVMAGAGWLYQAFANGAFFFMAGIAFASLLAALLLARVWDGERMRLSGETETSDK